MVVLMEGWWMVGEICTNVHTWNAHDDVDGSRLKKKIRSVCDSERRVVSFFHAVLWDVSLRRK